VGHSSGVGSQDESPPRAEATSHFDAIVRSLRFPASQTD
jgi:hypothetical protein